MFRNNQRTRELEMLHDTVLYVWIYYIRRYRRTVQQIQRDVVKSSCKSFKWHEFNLQVCRWYGRLVLETLTVYWETSGRMSIRLAVCQYQSINQSYFF